MFEMHLFLANISILSCFVSVGFIITLTLNIVLIFIYRHYFHSVQLAARRVHMQGNEKSQVHLARFYNTICNCNVDLLKTINQFAI